MDNKVDLSQSEIAAHEDPYVVKGAILRDISVTFIFSRIYWCVDFFSFY